MHSSMLLRCLSTQGTSLYKLLNALGITQEFLFRCLCSLVGVARSDGNSIPVHCEHRL